MGKKIISVLLILVLAACMPVVAMADPAARQPDYTRHGSINITLLTAADRTPVPGGTLELFPVAMAKAEDGNNILEYTADFAACGADLADVGNSDAVKAMANTLSNWAKEKKLSGTKTAVKADGTAAFSDLPLGLYLVTQPEALHGYEPVAPFLVTVPVWDEVSGELRYAVNAEPKCDGTVKMAVLDPPVKKIVTEKNGTAPADAVFRFQMTPGAKDYPMPNNSSLTVDAATGAMTMEVKGAGTYEFGKMLFGTKDVGKTYTYKIQEVAGTTERFTYDSTVYTMKVEVKESGGKIVLAVSKTKDGSEVSEITFTNIYEVPKSGGGGSHGGNYRLPQTGLLWWPIPVMLMLGLALVAFGYFQNRRRDLEEQ